MTPTITTDIWVRTRKSDGTYEGHYEKVKTSEFDGVIFTGPPETPQITLKNGRVLDVYAGNDGELGYIEEIDKSEQEKPI
jgi:hypothetical protein